MSDTALGEPGIPENDSFPRPLEVLLRQAPRVRASLATLTRRVGRGLRIALPAHEADMTLRLASAASIATSSSPALLLSGPAGALRLEDGTRCLRALTGIDLTATLEQTASGDCPDWLVAAVAGRLADTPLGQVARIERAAQQDDEWQCSLDLDLRQDGHLIAVRAHARPQTWLSLLDEVDATPLRAPLEDFLEMAWRQPIYLGHHRLPASACAALAAGDILLPSSPRFDAEGNGRVNLAGCRWRMRYLAPGNLQLISLEPTLDIESEEDISAMDPVSEPLQDPAADEDEPVALEEVPLTLAFELGRIGLSLGELRSLAPQTILSLHEGGPHAINILCGGRRVGRGEAVDVEGTLGIRIVQWGGAC